ncbi:efflux RND transporter periplasmic adaptor subunit [Vibrio vulnificus]|uniref:efflux RND transporter periplasmic adaptor subunit n=1 Tax=Vibrio vulnificus TaxID=672 RepID=UPI001022B0AA|nr:HlyD family efflux transporter periplasmic adaptor subunit [Vibrio vulnificus]RZP69431.1 HlyD family efflux transporter periplasmic adaptor subunit [Vibrio vulnificus]RZR14550.1 HlyD family efflux transporter periplasmic adaptor subunit [Vibrio vulnificus]HDY7972657.1 HlyD family efflux transporter periplasmic adaptor subunit [Vibrio vulnificus]
MDIKKQQKASFPVKKVSLITLSLVLVIAGVYFSSVMSTQLYQVDKSNVIISTVSHGPMAVEVRGNGILAPKYIRWISSNVDGRVERVLVKPGAVVKEGDVIAEMVNPELAQKTEEIRWELEAAHANLQALKLRHNNNVLDAQTKVLKAKHNYEKAKLEYEAEKTLYKRANGSVSKIDFDRSRLDTEQYKQSWEIEKQRLATLKTTQEAEFVANQAMLNGLKRSLDRSQYLLDSLTVVANQNGVIQAVDIEAGQRVPVGNNIAKLAQQGDLIAELDIPERQVRDVALGQAVTINTHNTIIDGQVARIDPAVVNGTVQVDVSLTSPLPPEVRPDLSIQGTIEVSSVNQTLFVTRPSYAQSNAPGSVFKISPDGLSATRVPVTFGLGSADNIEIKSGLSAADRIITSNTNAWSHLDQISIN